MKNRYITALLLVLAVAGVEAQTFQSAQKLTLENFTGKDIISQPKVKVLKTDILSLIKSFQYIDKKDYTHLGSFNQHLFIRHKEYFYITGIITSHNKNNIFILQENPSIGKSIVIRAPGKESEDIQTNY